MKNVEICVRAIIQSKGRILVCWHKEKRYYFFPGGHVDFGEMAESALSRELKEELDIDIEVEEHDFFMTVQHQYPDFEIIMHSFICKVKDKRLDMKEHINCMWLTIPDLKTPDWAQADVPIVDKIMNGEFIL